MRYRRIASCLLASLVVLILDNGPNRFICGYDISYDVVHSNGPADEGTSKACWIFSHMPKSGGFTIQSMLKTYARIHDVSLGRYDTENWVKGSRFAESFLDAGHTLIGGGYTDGLRLHGGQGCKWFTMFRQ